MSVIQYCFLSCKLILNGSPQFECENKFVAGAYSICFEKEIVWFRQNTHF